MTKECPTCEKDFFKTEASMRSHHTQAHGESIAGYDYTCEWCGERGTKSQIDDRDDHQFCSTECYHTWRRNTLVGEESPAWEGKTVKKDCEWCGQSVVKQLAHIEGNERAFCNQDCHGNWLSENRRGENATRWKGGIDLDYGPNWGRKRQMRLEEDNHSCVVCGMEENEHKHTYGTSLHVHHIQPMRQFKSDDGEMNHERANRLNNLVTLCVSCHSRWEGIPLRPEVQ